jgi:hypothetical protein
MKALEKALRNDARNTVNTLAPEHSGTVGKYDKFVKEHLTEGASGKSPGATLKQMGSSETDNLMNYALGGAKGGGARLEVMRDMMPEDQWETFKQATLQKMGSRAGGTDEFSLAQFTTEWRRMDNKAKKAIFGDDYSYLDRMAELGEKVKIGDMEKNVSKTAQSMIMGSTLQAMIPAGIGGAGGDMLTAAASGAASVAAPWLAAKGLTSQGFGRFAAGGGMPGVSALGGIGVRGLTLTPEMRSLLELERARTANE